MNLQKVWNCKKNKEFIRHTLWKWKVLKEGEIFLIKFMTLLH